MENTSKSEVLYNHLIELGKKITLLETKEYQFEDSNTANKWCIANGFNDNYKVILGCPILDRITFLEDEFKTVFIDLIEQSTIDNYYWQYCPFEVFKSAIHNEKEQYLMRGNSFTLQTFCDEEIRNIKDFLVRPGKTSKGKKLGVAKSEVYINFALPIYQIGENQIKFKYHVVPILNSNTKARIISTQKQKIKYLKEQKQNIKENNSKSNTGRPLIISKVQSDYIECLKQYFQPINEFEKFIKGSEFKSPIDFKGNQQQLASIFIQLKDMQELNYTDSNEITGKYIKNNFTCNGKECRIICDYITKRKSIKKEKYLDVSI